MFNGIKSLLFTRVLISGIEGGCVSRNMSTKNIKFNTKHLATGDPLPPYTGKLRVYNMRYCPYAQRVILALNAKNIDYEVVNVDLMKKPEWLTTKSPFGKVPALEIKENFTIYESLPLVEYIDEVYPGRPLLPKDPIMKAYDKIIIESTGPIHTFFVNSIKFPERINEETIANYKKALTFIQDQLASRGTKFLDGSEPGYVDYMIWPWFERMLMFAEDDKRAAIDPAKFKLLREYLDNMLKDPLVIQYSVPKEVFFKFVSGYRRNELDYNLIVED